MKKINFLLFSGILIISLANAKDENRIQESQNNGINISKSFEVRDKLKPSFLFSTIRIESSSKLRNIGELKDETRANITTTLNNIIQESKKYEICKGGSYSINPIISHKDDKRSTIGQEVRFNMDCKFSENEDLATYNKLLKSINQIIAKNNLLALPQPQVSSQITQDEISAKKENMFLDFLNKTKEIESSYSSGLNLTCKINKINSRDDYMQDLMPRVAMSKGVLNTTMEADSTHTKAPIIDDVDIAINVYVEMNCK